MSPLTETTSGLDWDENGQPTSKEFGDVYFSKTNGLEETRHVFIKNNNLEERFKALKPRERFTIGETGFGTGLNFLAVWQLFSQTCLQPSSPKYTRLHFISVEKYPLNIADLNTSLTLWPELTVFSDQLIEQYPTQPASGIHRLFFDDGRVSLTLYFGEAQTGFSEINPVPPTQPIHRAAHKTDIVDCGEELAGKHAYSPAHPTVDAWFLDGFSPAKNPDMWRDELFEEIAKLSENNTTLATFTAAGFVRRGLEQVGFNCSKTTGFGTKREMLRASFSLPDATHPATLSDNESYPNAKSTSGDGPAITNKGKAPPVRHTYWHLTPSSTLSTIPATAMVIGGGISGCQTAFALANKGIKVALIEQHKHLATQASGNKQGIVYTKLSPHPDLLSQFNFAAQQYADRFYTAYGFYDKCGQACGVFHQASSDKQKELFQQFVAQHKHDERFYCWLTAKQASLTTGVKQDVPGLFLPLSGWLNPVSLCEHLSRHENIVLFHSTRVEHLMHSGKQWIALDKHGRTLAQADAAVIASAGDAKALITSQRLPLKPIRGQVTHFPQDASLKPPKTAICGDGYIAPPIGDIYTTGATFTLNENSEFATIYEHRQNLSKLVKMIPEYKGFTEQLAVESLDGKVGFRCTTPDYFPIAGPVVDEEAMVEQFTHYRKNANARIAKAGTFLPHLYCNLGQGSRGLAYTPLTSELIASMISGEPLPVSKQLALHLHPARFLIRDLMRNKI